MDILDGLFGHGHGQEVDRFEVYRGDLEATLTNVEEGYELSRQRVQGVFGTKYSVDEMALWFPNPDAAMAWISVAVAREGYELFNSAEDEVVTSPIPGRYEVRYWFLRTPFEYRIEVMCLGRGFSPYHNSIEGFVAGNPFAIAAAHASFKVTTDEEYANAVRALTASGYGLYQHCTSAYGKFSYFRNMEDVENEFKWPLKPRINMRDGAE